MAKPCQLGEKKQDRPIAIEPAVKFFQTSRIPYSFADFSDELASQWSCMQAAEVAALALVSLGQGLQAASVNAEEAQRVRMRDRDGGCCTWRTKEARAMRGSGPESTEAVVTLDVEAAIMREAENQVGCDGVRKIARLLDSVQDCDTVFARKPSLFDEG